MSRNSRFSKELKMRVIHEYREGLKGSLQISDELNIYKDTIYKWNKLYEVHGSAAFDTKPRNRAYSKTDKITAVKEFLNGEHTVSEIMKRYEITSSSILRNWVKKYNDHVELKDYDPKGEVYMAKNRKTTYEERLEIVHYCLRNERKYTHTAEAYDVSYDQVYRWVKKYEKHGAEGLLDRRGKSKREEDLTETEKLKRENERLRRQNERLTIERDVLKKLKEIERRRASQKSGKK